MQKTIDDYRQEYTHWDSDELFVECPECEERVIPDVIDHEPYPGETRLCPICDTIFSMTR